MKRVFIFALMLALLLGSARAAPEEETAALAVRMEETAALLGADGSVILDEGAYADIVPLDGALFAATTDGALYALMDAGGALLTEAVYGELRLADGLLTARRGGGWGLLSRDGGELTDFNYEAILPTGAGNAWALRPGEDDLGLVLLDELGRARFTSLRALRWGEAGDGMLALQAESGLWGYCDASGRLAIPARYDWAGRFVEGCAPVASEGGWGAIGKDGEWLAAPEFERLEVSPGGFMLASGGGAVTVLDAEGGVRARFEGDGVWAAPAGEGYAVCDGESLRVFSADGSLLESLAPDAAVTEGVGGQLVLSEGMWGELCVRLSGTQARYQDLYPLGTAGGEAVYACLEVRSARYENDLLREVQLSVDMDSARYGLVGASGEQLLACEFAWLGFLGDDRFLARTETDWRMIDSSGKVYWKSRTAERLASAGF